MRRPFVAGNWKMNLDREASVALAKAVCQGLKSGGNVEVGICPPNVYLDAVIQAVGNSSVGVGAQNVYFESNGAFTGEISTTMVQDLGCRYVILGHSERRNVLGESNEDVNRKLKVTLAAELVPIVCVGELLEEREAGRTMDVVRAQFKDSFASVTPEEMSRCVIAYEPVWAIGTGRVATPEQAEEVHANVRGILSEQFGDEIASAVRIQYGGSVKPDNAAVLMAQPNIDGALVGGAALNASDFLAIVAAADA